MTSSHDLTKGNITELSSAEQQRLDGFLSSARTFHTMSFILAGISLVILFLNKTKELTLPFDEIALPVIQASSAIYLVTVVLAILTERLFSMAYEWMNANNRRLPFARLALSSHRSS